MLDLSHIPPQVRISDRARFIEGWVGAGDWYRRLEALPEERYTQRLIDRVPETVLTYLLEHPEGRAEAAVALRIRWGDLESLIRYARARRRARTGRRQRQFGMLTGAEERNDVWLRGQV